MSDPQCTDSARMPVTQDHPSPASSSICPSSFNPLLLPNSVTWCLPSSAHSTSSQCYHISSTQILSVLFHLVSPDLQSFPMALTNGTIDCLWCLDLLLKSQPFLPGAFSLRWFMLCQKRSYFNFLSGRLSLWQLPWGSTSEHRLANKCMSLAEVSPPQALQQQQPNFSRDKGSITHPHKLCSF